MVYFEKRKNCVCSSLSAVAHTFAQTLLVWLATRPLVFSHMRTQPSFVLRATVVHLAPVSLTEQKKMNNNLSYSEGVGSYRQIPIQAIGDLEPSEFNWDWCPAWGLNSLGNCTDGRGEGTLLLIQLQCGVMLKCVFRDLDLWLWGKCDKLTCQKHRPCTWEWDGGLRPRKQAGNGGHFGLDLAWLYLTSCNVSATMNCSFKRVHRLLEFPDQAISNPLYVWSWQLTIGAVIATLHLASLTAKVNQVCSCIINISWYSKSTLQPHVNLIH